MKQVKINDQLIAQHTPPYIIAEACNNFNGDVKVAKRMIESAYTIGCDAIKFQMRLQKDRITPDQHAELKAYCERIGITYICTAFDVAGLYILKKMEVAAIKIGSAECINEEFINKARKLDIPLIISTGGCSRSDVNTIAMYADIMLHCTSIYPTPSDKVNLDLIPQYAFDYQNILIGFSDHTPGIYASIGAAALGARVIEKHFILDYHMDTTDIDVSLDHIDMAQLVEGCRYVHTCQGTDKKFYQEEEEKLRLFR